MDARNTALDAKESAAVSLGIAVPVLVNVAVFAGAAKNIPGCRAMATCIVAGWVLLAAYVGVRASREALQDATPIGYFKF